MIFVFMQLVETERSSQRFRGTERGDRKKGETGRRGGIKCGLCVQDEGKAGTSRKREARRRGPFNLHSTNSMSSSHTVTLSQTATPLPYSVLAVSAYLAAHPELSKSVDVRWERDSQLALDGKPTSEEEVLTTLTSVLPGKDVGIPLCCGRKSAAAKPTHAAAAHA
jgi:hypothetical protein